MVTVRQAGYAGDIVLRVTFEDDAQTLRQVEVLEQNETETLGSRITEPEFLGSVRGCQGPGLSAGNDRGGGRKHQWSGRHF